MHADEKLKTILPTATFFVIPKAKTLEEHAVFHETAAVSVETDVAKFLLPVLPTKKSLGIQQVFLSVLGNTLIAKVPTSPTSLYAPCAENNILMKALTL